MILVSRPDEREALADAARVSLRGVIDPELGESLVDLGLMYFVAVKELTHGPALDDRRVDALVAFLKTLTDARYEKLLDE